MDCFLSNYMFTIRGKSSLAVCKCLTIKVFVSVYHRLWTLLQLLQ